MAEIDTQAQEEEANLRIQVKNFLTDENGDYVDKIRSLIDQKSKRLPIDLHDLRHYDQDLAADLLDRPLDFVLPFQEVLSEVIQTMMDPTEFQKEVDLDGGALNEIYQVGFEGSFGPNHVTPRGLRAKLISKMVCVEGIVTKASLVRPKVVKSVHYCKETKKQVKREYRDAMSLSKDGPTTSVYPTKDEHGNPYQTEYGLCVYKDHQTVTLQEMPESAPMGQLPRSVDVILEGDLVDRVKPGDRVRMIGIYRALAGTSSGQTSGIFRTVIIGNNVLQIGKDVGGVIMTPNDIQNIRAVAKRNNVFNLLSRSLAPSIYGHSFIKKALLLMLMGGVEKNLDNGTHLRGDINIMMVGDPSTAKSQLLRFVLRIAPLAINTTGRGSSGVGLTAAVTSDPDTGERRLEAGAMVLADRGVVCIDEFDKMNDADRVAIHEVMEQQTVTIAKAGIHTSLNARCSVLAAANPIYGAYDRTLSAQRNVSLPDSLLSRFDLLFIVLDTMDPTIDRAISNHVIRMHRYQRPGQEGIPIPLNGGGFNTSVLQDDDAENDDGEENTPVYQKVNPLLHGGIIEEIEEEEALERQSLQRAPSPGGSSSQRRIAQSQNEKLVTVEFAKKFIHYAKNRLKPTLTDEANERISAAYAEMRSGAASSQRTLPVTARALETIIRLSSAHAKVRLSQKVEVQDVDEALKIMNFALNNNAEARPHGSEVPVNPYNNDVNNSNNNNMDVDSSNFDGGSDNPDSNVSTNASKKRDAVSSNNNSNNNMMMGDKNDMGGNASKRQKVSSTAATTTTTTTTTTTSTSLNTEEARLAFLKRQLMRLGRLMDDDEENDENKMSVADLLRELNAKLPTGDVLSPPFTEDELDKFLKILESENKLMYRDGEIHLI